MTSSIEELKEQFEHASKEFNKLSTKRLREERAGTPASKEEKFYENLADKLQKKINSIENKDQAGTNPNVDSSSMPRSTVSSGTETPGGSRMRKTRKHRKHSKKSRKHRK
jgi:hypothetical protein